MFIMSLAIADLTVGLVVMPVSSAYALSGVWYFGDTVCQAWLSVDYTASTASIFNLVILSLDRYWSITSPLRYLRRRTRRRALLMIIVAWAASATWLLPITVWPGHRNNDWRMASCDTRFAEHVPFKVAAAGLNFYLPTCFMLYLYARIFLAVKKRSLFGLSVSSPVTDVTYHKAQISHCPRNCSSARGGYAEELSDRGSPTVLSETSATLDQTLGQGQDSSNGSSYPGKAGKKNTSTQCSATSSCAECCEREVNPSGKVYRNLTLVAIECGRRHFDGVTINVEYEDEGSGSGMVSVHGKEGTLRNRDDPRHSRHRRCYRALGKNENSSIRTRWPRALGKEDPSLRKEQKAARQLGVIMGAYLLCWLPYFILFPVMAFCTDCVPPQLHLAATWLGYCNSTMNPVLYPLCNANFKRAFKRMLGLRSDGMTRGPARGQQLSQQLVSI